MQDGFNYGPRSRLRATRVIVRPVVLHNGETVAQKALRVLADASRTGSIRGTQEYLQFTAMLGVDPQTGEDRDENIDVEEAAEPDAVDLPAAPAPKPFGSAGAKSARIQGTRIAS
jgi:hypothetical protein